MLNRDFDYHRYLATLEADGLNYTRLFGGSYVEVPAKSFGILHNDLAPEPGRFLAPWARSDSPGYAGGGNKFDLEKWDSEFFARYRDFLAEAAKRGIVVEVTLFSAHYAEAQWQMSALNSANNINSTDAIDWKKLNTLENGNILAYQEKYARKLVREANAFDNVIFEIQNEPWSDRTVLTDVINPYLRPPGVTLIRTLWIYRMSFPWRGKHALPSGSRKKNPPFQTAISSPRIIPIFVCRSASSCRTSTSSTSTTLTQTQCHSTMASAKQSRMTKPVFSAATTMPIAAKRGISCCPVEARSALSTIPLQPATKTAPSPSPTVPAEEVHRSRHQLQILSQFLQSFSLVDLRPDYSHGESRRGCHGSRTLQSRQAVRHLPRRQWPRRIDSRSAARTITRANG